MSRIAPHLLVLLAMPTSPTPAEPPPPGAPWPTTTPSPPSSPTPGDPSGTAPEIIPASPHRGRQPVRRAPEPSLFPEAFRPDQDEPTGLDQVAELWGLSLLRSDVVFEPGGAANVQVDTLGVRYWLNARFGVDAGVGVFLLAPDAATPVSWGISPLLGVPVAVKQWKHLTTYVKPQFSAYFVRFDGERHRFQVSLAALGGGEIHFGFINLPAVSLAVEGGLEFVFFRGKAPDPLGPYTGDALRIVRLPTLDSLFDNIALRIYF